MPKIKRDETGKLVVNRQEAKVRRELNAPQLDRDKSGQIVWGWKQNTDAIDASQQQQLIQNGDLKPEEARLMLFDRDRKPVYLHAGSVHWNAFRCRWIMLAEQLGGKSSFLGEIWYAEAQQLEGPWENARHVVSHDKYSFYNPAHYRFLDQQGGRLIYFQGTYADTFSATARPTPRYNYNQIMYHLDLASPRLKLPAGEK